MSTMESQNDGCRDFGCYAPLLRALPKRQRFEKAELLVPEFRMRQHGSLMTYYAPFDYVNAEARVFLLGITPSWAEMELAYRVARQGLDQGLDAATICQHVKRQASFVGPMRRNLTNMLDQLGLPALLGIPSSNSLFAEKDKHLHVSAVIRYPTFVNGSNYTGHSPGILSTPIMREWIELELAEELRLVQEAVLIPLGKAVAVALTYLIDQGVLERERCLIGFPHPSGANPQRNREFATQREALAQQLTNLLSKNLEVIKGDNNEAAILREIARPSCSSSDYCVGANHTKIY